MRSSWITINLRPHKIYKILTSAAKRVNQTKREEPTELQRSCVQTKRQSRGQRRHRRDCDIVIVAAIALAVISLATRQQCADSPTPTLSRWLMRVKTQRARNWQKNIGTRLLPRGYWREGLIMRAQGPHTTNNHTWTKHILFWKPRS